MTGKERGSGRRTRQRRPSSGDRSLGDRLRKFRTRLNLSQENVAHQVGRSEGWLLLVENGRADPGYSDIVELARVLQVDLTELIHGKPQDRARLISHGPGQPRSTEESAAPPDSNQIALGDFEELDVPVRLAGHGEDNTKRRDALRYGLATAATALTGGALLDPGLLFERLASVDDQALDYQDALVEHFAHETWIAPSGSLLPVVRLYFTWLQTMAAQSLVPPAARRLALLSGKAAAVLGRLSFQLDNRGDALGYWATAEQLARDVGDGPLRAHVLVERSRLFSRSSYSNSYSDSTHAIALLDEAGSVAGWSQPHLLTWLHTRRGLEYAVLGDLARSSHDLDLAARALANAQTKPRGLFSEWDDRMLRSFHGSCVLFLNDNTEAVRVLEGTLAETNLDSRPPDIAERNTQPIPGS